MRDSLSMMERLEPLLIHNQVTTATPLIQLFNKTQQFPKLEDIFISTSELVE